MPSPLAHADNNNNANAAADAAAGHGQRCITVSADAGGTEAPDDGEAPLQLLALDTGTSQTGSLGAFSLGSSEAAELLLSPPASASLTSVGAAGGAAHARPLSVALLTTRAPVAPSRSMPSSAGTSPHSFSLRALQHSHDQQRLPHSVRVPHGLQQRQQHGHHFQSADADAAGVALTVDTLPRPSRRDF